MLREQFILTLLFLVATSISCKGQDDGVYEIPFSMEKKLLVLKGKLNGIETDFAFDTGAAEGIATINDEKRNGIERKQGSQRILDGNGKITYLQPVYTKELSIGGFSFKNVRASISEMQYLYCMDLYLLGADIIRQLNWEIDFKKMIVRVSKKRFETIGSMTEIPVNYQYNTPRISLTVNELKFKDVLIDIGFTGVMTIPNIEKQTNGLLENKRLQHQLTSKITSSFAAGGVSKPSLTETALIDSIRINGKYFHQIPTEFRTDTDFKIGLGFFSSLCEKLIINNSDKKYYLLLKEKAGFKSSFSVSVLLKEGKLKTSSITIAQNPEENDFAINEEIKSINGRTATDFKDECDFLNWYYINSSKWDKMTIEKLNGKLIVKERTPIR